MNLGYFLLFKDLCWFQAIDDDVSTSLGKTRLYIIYIFLEEEPAVKPEEIVITEKYESLHIMTIGINRKRVN